MAVLIKLICTDRNGRRLAQAEFKSELYQTTSEQRQKQVDEWMLRFQEPNMGVKPYVFHEVTGVY
jgi:hypothetical protein